MTGCRYDVRVRDVCLLVRLALDYVHALCRDVPLSDWGYHPAHWLLTFLVSPYIVSRSEHYRPLAAGVQRMAIERETPVMREVEEFIKCAGEAFE